MDEILKVLALPIPIVVNSRNSSFNSELQVFTFFWYVFVFSTFSLEPSFSAIWNLIMRFNSRFPFISISGSYSSQNGTNLQSTCGAIHGKSRHAYRNNLRRRDIEFFTHSSFWSAHSKTISVVWQSGERFPLALYSFFRLPWTTSIVWFIGMVSTGHCGP